eukprot:5444495-Amphidinium_carterae.2
MAEWKIRFSDDDRIAIHLPINMSQDEAEAVIAPHLAVRSMWLALTWSQHEVQVYRSHLFPSLSSYYTTPLLQLVREVNAGARKLQESTTRVTTLGHRATRRRGVTCAFNLLHFHMLQS